MRFIVDECAGPLVANWLREQGHDVFSVYEQARGMEDDRVIIKACDENRILITTDKDFGEQVYRERKTHQGVILLRLSDERAAAKIRILKQLLDSYADKIPGQFVVVTEKRVRFAKP